MPIRDRQIKYNVPNYPIRDLDLSNIKNPKEFPPLYNTDNVEKRTVEPIQHVKDSKIDLPFRSEENVCSYCGWVRQDPKQIAHVCENCGQLMPGHTWGDNVGNRHEQQGEGFGQDARFPDSEKNGAIHTEMMYENVRQSQRHPEEIKAEHEYRTGQAYNSGNADDWKKPKLEKLEPYKLFKRNLDTREDVTEDVEPLQGAGFGLLYGNPYKDKIWNNFIKQTDRKYLREHMEGL